jgi:hypothetical protein
MDDGRHFTDYRPRCHTENLTQSTNNVHSNFQYRMFLTQNANKLMELNRSGACDKNCCSPCQSPYNVGTTMKETQARVCDPNVPCGEKVSATPSVDTHSNQPLDCAAWNPKNNQKNRCVSDKDFESYYGDNNNIAVKRLSTSGGVPLGDKNFWL